MLKKSIIFLVGTLSCTSIALADTQPIATPLTQESTQQEDGFGLYIQTPNAVKPMEAYYSLKPGDTVKDSVQLENFSNDKTFSLFISDRIYDQKTHSMDYTKQDQSGKMAQLVTFDNGNSISLKSWEQIPINYTITIPKNLPLGTYEGGITAIYKMPAINNPNLTIATQYIQGIEINVTNNPQPVPKLTRTVTYTTYGPTPYLIGSALLFLACISYYIYASRKEKKAKKLQAHGHAHDHDHEHKHEHSEHHHDHPEHPKK